LPNLCCNCFSLLLLCWGWVACCLRFFVRHHFCDTHPPPPARCPCLPACARMHARMPCTLHACTHAARVCVRRTGHTARTHVQPHTHACNVMCNRRTRTCACMPGTHHIYARTHTHALRTHARHAARTHMRTHARIKIARTGRKQCVTLRGLCGHDEGFASSHHRLGPGKA